MVHHDPVRALRMENARLRQALGEAQVQVARLQASLDTALAELAALRKQAAISDQTQRDLLVQIATLAEQVAKGNERIGELLAIAQRKKRKPAKPRGAPPAPADVDDAARAAFDSRPTPPDIPPKPEKEPKPSSPTGRKPLPDHLPVDPHTVYPDVCGCGCEEFEIVDEVVEEKLTVVKEHQRRRVVRRKTGRCKHCRKTTTARSLPAPFSTSGAV